MDSPSKTIDSLKFEKENAMARFNRVRRVMKLLQIIEVAAVFAAISWCLPAVARTAAACLTHLCNQYAAFLFGNAIIMLLLVLCRQSDGAGGGGDLHDDYVRHSEIARALPAEIGGCDCDKQIVAADETIESSQSQCDDVAAVIEKAARQIRRLQRNRSEIAKRREVTVRPENRRETVCSEIENLSNEEFQRKVDAFIDKHWIKTTPKLEGSLN
ncbi:hypothetical protein SASPL_116190 [Salvia splendens]|uniref:DUF4408 domain-containing protein n=1 Tax=Salvia splendens TaxID=180675 RepID=A0A8X8ZX06_SALSN|nr:hypothetical protein SASPL_116190 [Salvia splendens]